MTRERVAEKLYETWRDGTGNPTWKMMKLDGGYSGTIEAWELVADTALRMLAEARAEAFREAAEYLRPASRLIAERIEALATPAPESPNAPKP